MSTPNLPLAPIVSIVAAATISAVAATAAAEDIIHYHYGAGDGSAGVLIDATHFIGGEDEHDILRLYSLDPQAKNEDKVRDLFVLKRWPEFQKGLAARDTQETDIEAAALIGDIIYWIGSHSHGKPKNPTEARPYRSLLFATRMTGSGADVALKEHGAPFTGLIDAILKTPGSDLAALKTAIAVTGDPKDSPNTLNIEGLCAIDGTLYIGFRSPIPGRMALVLPVKNPAALVAGDPAATPDFGKLISVDLGGLGIRDMVMVDGKLFILAGSYKERDAAGNQDGSTVPRLYSCDISFDAQKQLSLTPHLVDVDFGDLNPEGILTHDGKGAALILSDDGKRPKGQPLSFRSVWLKDLPGRKKG